MPAALTFDALRDQLLTAAEKAGLETWAERAWLDLASLDRTFTFSVVPKGWKPPQGRSAQIKVYYNVNHAALAEEGDEDEDEPDDLDTELEIEVAYFLVTLLSKLALKDLAGHVEPLAAKINKALGGQQRQGYYMVSSGHPETGESHVVEAKVEDLHMTSVIEDEFDAGFMKGVAAALKAVGPA